MIAFHELLHNSCIIKDINNRLAHKNYNLFNCTHYFYDDTRYACKSVKLQTGGVC